MNSKTNIVRAILLDASECDRPEADHPATIEICADDLQRILERHITEPAQCLHQIAEPAEYPALPAHLMSIDQSDDDTFGALTDHAWGSGFSDGLALNAPMFTACQMRAYVDADRAQRAAAPQAVQPAVPVDVVSDLKNALADATEMRRQLRLMEENARGDVWRWQADAANELASMGNRMGVLIFASDLRNLLAAPAHPAEGVPAAEAVEQIEAPSDGQAFEHWVSNCDSSGIQYHGPSYERGFLTGKIASTDEAEALAATQPAPAIFGDEDHVLVPRGLIGAACSAIDKKRDGTKTLAELRRYTTGDLSAATQPAAQGLDALNLTAHEYKQLLKAIEDYQESGETDVPDETLIRGVAAGYLECGHFKLINLAALVRDAAAAGVA